MKKKKLRSAESCDYLLGEDTPFIVNEAYSALCTNIIFSLPGESAKTIGVTSASHGDGKSTVTANLAIALAKLGKRVIVLDCDLRLPTMARKLGVKGIPGMSEMLVGEVKLGKESVQMIQNLGISVIPSGRIPPNAAKLLDSERFRMVIEVLRRHYDFILLDFPPILTVSDALIARDSVDGYVMVARHEQSDRSELAEMISKMQLANANPLGFVYVGAPVTERKRYGYYK